MDQRLLFVSPRSEDAGLISRMLAPAGIRCDHVAGYQEARRRLADESYGSILTEANLVDGDWKDVLSFALDLDATPTVIVTHRVADDRFWAEVLNLGCYDMLAQPFDPREVRRIVALACSQVRSKPATYMTPRLRAVSAAS